MGSPLMTYFLLGVFVGMLAGVYLGNKKFRRAFNNMIRSFTNRGEDYEDEYKEE